MKEQNFPLVYLLFESLEWGGGWVGGMCGHLYYFSMLLIEIHLKLCKINSETLMAL